MISLTKIRMWIFILFLVFNIINVFAPNDNSVQIYNEILGQDGDIGPIALNFSSQTILQSNFSHSISSLNNRLTFNEDGLYKIHYSCTWQTFSANNRMIMQNYLMLNGLSQIIPSEDVCYIRENATSGNRCSNSATILFNATSTDYIELFGDKLQGTGGTTLTHEDCSITSNKIKSAVAQIYDDTGGENVTLGLEISLNANTYINTTEFTRINSTTLNVSSGGLYKIHYQSCSEFISENTAGSNYRQTPQTYVLSNSIRQTPSTAVSYLRQPSTADRNCEEATTILNLSSGDTISLFKGLKESQTSEEVETLANMSWLFVEKINDHFEESLYYDTTNTQTIGSTQTPISFNSVLFNGSFIKQPTINSFEFVLSGLYELTYTLGWDDSNSGGRVVTCANFEINNTDFRPSRQCDYSRGTTGAGHLSIYQNSIVNVSKGDTLRFVANATRSVTLEGNETWIVIRKLDENPKLLWNETNKNLGLANIGDGNLSSNSTLLAYQDHTNVNISCISGDCGTISLITNSLFNLNSTQESNIGFSCSDTSAGKFNALFKANSTQYGLGTTINVSCEIFNPTGTISALLTNPIENTTIRVGQNLTRTITANILCNGNISQSCGNVSATLRFNWVYGDGSDGSLTVTSANTIVNNYTYLSANELAGETTLSVNSEANFSAGDEILIIQMQSGVGIGSAGNYEFATVDSTAAGTITIKTPTKNAYGSGTHDSLLSSATQIVRVPHYTDVTINSGASISAPAWNGYAGGIVVFRAQETINSTGYINVSEKGFRGGSCGSCGNNDWGNQGEGTTGIGTGSLNANANGGGGGFGPTGFGGEPGAGGGHATAGGNGSGSFNPTGGEAIGQANLSTIFFGGGAGGGGDNDGATPNPEFVDGGGIAMIFGKEISNARVLARGELGFTAGGSGGTTGGGAGGTIWIGSDNLTLIDINATGGDGGVNGADIGGDGSTGRIRLDYYSLAGNSDPSNGFNGINISNNFVDVSTINGTNPIWSLTPQPRNCILNGTQSCTVDWIVNITGPIGSLIDIDVFVESNLSIIQNNKSGIATLNITLDTIPTIILKQPENNSKVFGNGTIEFIWEVQDDSTNNTCSLYLNSNIVATLNCSSYTNTSINLSLASGYYSWNVSALDSTNNTGYSETFNFYNILNKSIRFDKSIRNVNTNQYFIETKITNGVNYNYNFTYLDFVPSNFTLGSETPSFSFFNITNGPNYFGRIYAWNTNTTVPQINYSLSGIGKYHLRDVFILGGEIK